MLVPERTVDSLLANELLAAFPRGIIWSPTNKRWSLDHEFEVTSRQVLLFECKGIQEGWNVSIRKDQLDMYVDGGLGRLLYLLPSKPITASNPWKVECEQDPNVDGECSICNEERSWNPRRTADTEAHIVTASAERRMQPWFNHWSWCVSAFDLQAHLDPVPKQKTLSCDDEGLDATPGAVRLCHLLGPGAGPRGDKSENPEDEGGQDHPESDESGYGNNSSNGPLGDYLIKPSAIERYWDFVEKHEGGHNVRPGSVGVVL